MPTILRHNGFRFFFYSREPDEPAHIHVIGRGGTAKVWLASMKFHKIYGLKPKDQKDILEIIMANKDLLTSEWSKYHG